MDIASIFLFCLMSIVIGAVLMLLIQYYAFIRYFNLPEETAEQKIVNEKFLLPDNILASIKSPDPESKYPIVALNLIMQFLFHELKYSNHVRKWFYRKLSLELDELITKTTTGKLFDKLTIRDLDLGGQFPEMKNLRVHNSELHETEGHLENLDILLDLQYNGNFRVSIDADMVLGKKGSLTLKVKHLSGLARLQFTRKPYTHWSLSFLGDPQLELGIESQFQGRQMQSNVTSLILSQIRKAVRRKHTLPNYKIRYKPFFHKTEEEMDTEITPNGKIEVRVSELSRLMIPPLITHVYCTLTLASLPWVEARQRDDKNVIISLDVEIHKAKNQQIGIVFKQTDNSVQIEAVLPNTPAVKANLRSGDILISIEGKRVNTINQVAKLIKNLSRPVFSLRIERICVGLIKNDAILEDFELYDDLTDANISFSKSSDSVQIGGTLSKPPRNGSIDKGTSSESSLSNTPSNSPRKNQIIAKSLTKNVNREQNIEQEHNLNINPADDQTNSIVNSISGISYSSSIKDKINESKIESPISIESFPQHSTIDSIASSYIRMEDVTSFKLNDNSLYLNVCVYGKWNADSVLLGYLNVPINNVLVECSESNSGHHLKIFSLMPPDTAYTQSHPLSAKSGFDANLCFGDILLSFVWSGNTTSLPLLSEGSKRSKSARNSTDKLEESDKPENGSIKIHNFIRTHFHRATQCDFCGKKIWLKDAVQCRNCSMCCHKKCITKCQNSTVCGPVDCSTMSPGPQSPAQPEFKVTEAPLRDGYDIDEFEEILPKSNGHRQSFSDLLQQGLKRVNSANNLAIPGIVASISQSSRSLPPTPQHTPRKQSLVNQSANPFVSVTQKLEKIPNEVTELSSEQIAAITESLVGWSKVEDMMSLAKTSSKTLYSDLEPNERVERINILLTKLRIALDSETSSHAVLTSPGSSPAKQVPQPTTTEQPTSPTKTENIRPTSDGKFFFQTKPAPVVTETPEHEMARKAILIGQSEERVQALSVIMLYLCTGLQHAQGVAFH